MTAHRRGRHTELGMDERALLRQLYACQGQGQGFAPEGQWLQEQGQDLATRESNTKSKSDILSIGFTLRYKIAKLITVR